MLTGCSTSRPSTAVASTSSVPTARYVRHIKAGSIPTNCVFSGRDLIMTDAGIIADSADASYGGQLWRLGIDADGLTTWRGHIG